MNHQPNIMDASADLRRCISADLGDKSFNVFFQNAKNIIFDNTDKLSIDTKNLVIECLKKSEIKNLQTEKRKEHLLTAASLLQIEYLSQLKHHSD